MQSPTETTFKLGLHMAIIGATCSSSPTVVHITGNTKNTQSIIYFNINHIISPFIHKMFVLYTQPAQLKLLY